jgi:hypothetical protein
MDIGLRYNVITTSCAAERCKHYKTASDNHKHCLEMQKKVMQVGDIIPNLRDWAAGYNSDY